MKIVLTGAYGFLGWHLRCRLLAHGGFDVVTVGRSNFGNLAQLVDGAEAVIHVAGVNRGSSDDEVRNANIDLARAVAAAVKAAPSPPRIIYANSIQALTDSPYGTGKRVAGEILAEVASQLRVEFVDVMLPNLFGEHGRPRYNSFVATFADGIANGQSFEVADRQVELLHAQDAAESLIGALSGPSRDVRPRGEMRGVAEIADLLAGFRDVYQRGEVPELAGSFEQNLFNTFRAAGFPRFGVTRFEKRTDPRGSLVETVKSHGSGGQVFFSSTVPGVTRGEHFHLKKIERFVVISGTARIQLRRLFTNQLTSFEVTGENPVAIDMPTMWAHNITNTGDSELLTLFWTDSIFDPAAPDTYPQSVAKKLEMAE